MLAIAMQRGLLHHLLDWVDLALQVSATAQCEAKKGVENKYGRTNNTFFKAVLAQMIEKPAGSVSCYCSIKTFKKMYYIFLHIYILHMWFFYVINGYVF